MRWSLAVPLARTLGKRRLAMNKAAGAVSLEKSISTLGELPRSVLLVLADYF